jgi:hypothetical protein
MPISKQEYVTRSLQKISHKSWELYVVSRILHRLDDDDVEFVTQQAVFSPTGKIYFTDIYFPQLSLHVEIDEKYHEKPGQREKDISRERDIIQVTNHQFERIKITDEHGLIRDLSDIKSQIDEAIIRIKKMKQALIEQKLFAPWDFERRFLSDFVIDKGYLDVSDNVVFKLQIEALKCFGFVGKGYQRGAWKVTDGSNDQVWFPRLFKHGSWHNRLEDDGKTIIEKAIDEKGVSSIHVQKENEFKNPKRNHIVFAKAKDALGDNLLRYVGTFKMQLSQSGPDFLVFNRVRTCEPLRIKQQ